MSGPAGPRPGPAGKGVRKASSSGAPVRSAQEWSRAPGGTVPQGVPIEPTSAVRAGPRQRVAALLGGGMGKDDRCVSPSQPIPLKLQGPDDRRGGAARGKKALHTSEIQPGPEGPRALDTPPPVSPGPPARSTAHPASANRLAATNPLGPAPMTTASINPPLTSCGAGSRRARPHSPAARPEPPPETIASQEDLPKARPRPRNPHPILPDRPPGPARPPQRAGPPAPATPRGPAGLPQLDAAPHPDRRQVQPGQLVDKGQVGPAPAHQRPAGHLGAGSHEYDGAWSLAAPHGCRTQRRQGLICSPGRERTGLGSRRCPRTNP